MSEWLGALVLSVIGSLPFVALGVITWLDSRGIDVFEAFEPPEAEVHQHCTCTYSTECCYCAGVRHEG